MQGIGKSFGGHAVLRGVNFSLQAGEVHSVVGHNGAGKSTLMKILGGQIRRYEGGMWLDQRPLTLKNPRDAMQVGIAVIGQELSLVPNFHRSHNVMLGCELRNRWGLPSLALMQHRADAMLDALGFSVPDRIPVRGLPMAQQQMVEIARALQRNARVLVMDEPTARLAQPERRQLFEVIRRLCVQGVGVVYISHALEEVLQIAHRITVLRDGLCMHTGSAAALTLPQLRHFITGDQALPATPMPREKLPHARAIAPPSILHSARPAALTLRGFSVGSGPPNALEVGPGEIVGLAGCVGSGRSALLEAIAGAGGQHGQLVLNGVALRIRSVHQASQHGIFLLPEDRKRRGLVMPSSTGFNLILCALEQHFAPHGWVRAAACRGAITQGLALFDVRGAKAGSLPVRQLSGGNQQKVLLARACAGRPVLLLLDQPTVGVDTAAKVALHQHIRRLAAAGVACIFVTDELDELRSLADSIVVMQQGHMGPKLHPAALTNADLLAYIEVAPRSQVAPAQ